MFFELHLVEELPSILTLSRSLKLTSTATVNCPTAASTAGHIYTPGLTGSAQLVVGSCHALRARSKLCANFSMEC